MANMRKKMMEVSGAIHKKNEKLFHLRQGEKESQKINNI